MAPRAAVSSEPADAATCDALDPSTYLVTGLRIR
jgi:hypothetical protein